jgi:hypothetical protein
MLGFGDVWVFLAYFLTIGSAVLCVVYGIVNWNKPREDVDEEITEEAAWEKNDPELNEGGQK